MSLQKDNEIKIKKCITIINKKQLVQNINLIVEVFDYLWIEVKKLYYNEKFIKMPDDKKVAFVIKENSSYEKLLMNYPIILKMMVCVKDYNAQALKRYLFNLKKSFLINKKKMSNKKHKDFMEIYNGQKAFYLRYLYECRSEYKGYNKKFSIALYDKALETLNKELKIFLKVQDKYTKFLEKKKNDNKKDSIKDILTKIANGTFAGTNEEKKEIINLIKKKMSEIDKNEVIERKKINNLL